MGGIIILISIIVPTLLWAELSNLFIVLVLAATVLLERRRIFRRLSQSRKEKEKRADR